jgi:hypothetical protein
VQRAGEQVEAPDDECPELAGAQAAARGGVDQCPIAVVDGVSDSVDLLGLEEAHFLAMAISGQLDADTR